MPNEQDAGGRWDSFLANDVRLLTRAREPSPRWNLLELFYSPPPENPTFVPAKIDHLALEANPLFGFFSTTLPGIGKRPQVAWIGRFRGYPNRRVRSFAGGKVSPAPRNANFSPCAGTDWPKKHYGFTRSTRRPSCCSPLEQTSHLLQRSRLGDGLAGHGSLVAIGASALPTKAIYLLKLTVWIVRCCRSSNLQKSCITGNAPGFYCNHLGNQLRKTAVGFVPANGRCPRVADGTSSLTESGRR